MPATRSVALLALLASMTAWPYDAVTPSGKPVAATLIHDSERCREHTSLDACYDAIRWEPRNPALLVALGDTLERANRLPEAVRAYRRAAALEPNIPGIAAKIRAAEAKNPSKHVADNPAMSGAALQEASSKRFSNSDPVTQSH
jgi:cytochrome c-type biogenesis protein CcmH/NrfG